MSVVLVVEQESRYVERIQDALSRDGFVVAAVDNSDRALQLAAARRPAVALVSIDIEGSQLLLESLGKRAGGPGVVALVPERRAGELERWKAQADECLLKPFADLDLRQTVSRCARSSAATTAPADHKLTSAEIFGDLLAELRQEPAAEARPAAARSVEDDVKRKLEETLSGLVEGSAKKPAREPAPAATAPAGPAAPPPTSAAPAAPPRRPAPAPGQSEVDRLLSRTLDSLDLPRARPATAVPAAAKPTPPAPPSPAAPAAPAALSVPAATIPIPVVKPTPPPSATPPPPVSAPTAAPLPTAAAPAAASPATAPPAAADRLAAEPGQRFGQYTLLEKIAVGGMAEVWKARMTGLEGFEKLVAIKKILPHLTDNSAFVTMLIDEGKLAAQLTHPNITHIYDLGKIGDDYYIAMEYVEGRNLRALLNQARRHGAALPLGLALLITSRLASALDYAHRKKGFDGRELGLVHRDVSPQNVLISSEGEIKLCDFGIVKAVSKASHTQMGALKGKLQYMSPEQAWGRAVDGRSDLFSLGAILFEMLTGRRLFPGDNEMAVLDAVRECRIEGPRDLEASVPEDVDAIVRRALEKDPVDRFQTAGAMQQALERVLYALKPTPSQAELAQLLHRLFDESGGLEPLDLPEIGSGPRPAPAPPSLPPAREPSTGSDSWAGSQAAAHARPRVASPPPAISSPPPPAAAPASAVVSGLPPAPDVKVELDSGPKPKLGLIAAVAAAVLLAALATWYFFGRSKKAEPAAEITPAAAEAAPGEATPTAGEGVEGETAPAPTSAAEPGATAAPASGLDVEKLVDQELAKRQDELRRKLESEQKRLEEQLANAKAAEDERKRQAQAREAPAPATQPPPTAQAAPPPEPETAPEVSQPEPTRRPEPPPSEAPRSAQPPAAPPASPVEMPQVKVGQLVTPGPGVVMPSLVSITKPEYPAVARRLRVQGTVEVDVLVDETGTVRDTRLVSGVRQDVGMNEAALAAARTAKYRPATKDGVRVKIWTRLRVPFKLDS